MRDIKEMKNLIVSWIATGVSFLAGIVETNPVAQWVAFTLSCIASVFSLVYTGLKVIPLIVSYANKLKDSLKDGRISEEEKADLDKTADEIKEIVKDELDGDEKEGK